MRVCEFQMNMEQKKTMLRGICLSINILAEIVMVDGGQVICWAKCNQIELKRRGRDIVHVVNGCAKKKQINAWDKVMGCAKRKQKM